MRPMYVIGGAIVAMACIGVLAWTRLAPAQQAPAAPPRNTTPSETMTITLNEVEVRSGPSLDFFPTSKLKFGDRVEVIGKSDKNPGWLAIKPPPGSQSWINSRFVKMTDKHIGVVVAHDGIPAPVKPASSVTDKEPNVESVKLDNGTQVVVLGEPKYHDSGAWLPIEPPPGEVRYLPETAVAKTGVQTVGATGQGNGFVVPPGGDQSLVAEADAALLKAKQLLEKAAQSSDPLQRAQAQSKLLTLNQAIANGAVQQPGYPYTTAAQSGGPKATLLTVTSAQPNASTTAAYSTTAQSPAAAANGARWSVWGKLQKTAYNKDGLPVFKVVDERGLPKEYAIAAAGLTLEPYVGQMVSVFGVPTYLTGDDVLRNTLLVVSHLALPPRQ
jgi:hypothetical protein